MKFQFLSAILSFLLISLFFCAKTEEPVDQKISQQNVSENKIENKTSKEESVISENETIGKFIRANEDYDYWYLYIEMNGKTIRFLYNSEEISQQTEKFTGKKLKLKWIEKEFEEAGSGEMKKEKYLLSAEILNE